MSMWRWVNWDGEGEGTQLSVCTQFWAFQPRGENDLLFDFQG